MMEEKTQNTSGYTRGQRILALIAVILLVLLFVCALVFALIKTDWATTASRACLGCAIVIPVLIWIYIWMFGKIFHKHTIADVDLLGVPTDHSPAISADTTKLGNDDPTTPDEQ